MNALLQYGSDSSDIECNGDDGDGSAAVCYGTIDLSIHTKSPAYKLTLTDSDSDTNTVHTNWSTLTPSGSSGTESVNEKSLPAQTIKSAENSQCNAVNNSAHSTDCDCVQNNDYFGFQSGDNTNVDDIDNDNVNDEEKELPGNVTENKITIKTGTNVSLTVPNSSFWRDYSTMALAENVPDHRPWNPCNKRKTKSIPKHISKKATPLCTRAYKSKRIEMAANVINQSEQITHQQNEKQPCYFVHGKVARYLLSRSPSHVPREKIWTLSVPTMINRIEWCTPQYSHLLLCASMDGTVRIWDVFSSFSTSIRMLNCHDKGIKCATWSKDGKQILSCSYDRTAKISDVETGAELHCFDHKNFVTCGKYHPCNRNVCVTGSVNTILCWDTRCPDDSIREFTHKDRFGQVQDIEFLPDGSEFFSCNDLVSKDSADRTIMAWHFDSGVLLSNQIFQERYTCTRLRVHPTEGEFIAQTQGGYIAAFSTIRPYKLNKCKRYSDHEVDGYSIGCDYSADGRYIVSGNAAAADPMFYERRLARTLRPLNTTVVNDVCLDVAWHPVIPSLVAAATEAGDVTMWQ